MGCLQPTVVIAPPECQCVACLSVFCPGGLDVRGWHTYEDGREVPVVDCPRCNMRTRLVIATK